MTLFKLLYTSKKERDLINAAKILQASEFKKESMDYVLNLLRTGANYGQTQS